MENITKFILIFSVILIIFIIILPNKSENNINKINIQKVSKNSSENHKSMENSSIIHNANSLVLSCIDYRFIGPTMDYIYGLNNKNDFDYFVLAGSSLGYNQSIDTSGIWSITYEEHIRIAIKLHHIKEIIVIDHMDCGYYSAIYGEEVNTPEKEEYRHKYNINKFIDTLKNNPEFSYLSYTGLLINVDDENNLKFNVIYEDH